jgi:hypothetical protein
MSKKVEISLVRDDNYLDSTGGDIVCRVEVVDTALIGREAVISIIAKVELQRFGELRYVARLLSGGHTLIVANHLHPAWVRLFNMRWPAEHFYTDRSTDKLQRFLEERGVRFTPERLREFGQAYGANYTDLEIILEHSGGKDFDLAFERFRHSASIELGGRSKRDTI